MSLNDFGSSVTNSPAKPDDHSLTTFTSVMAMFQPQRRHIHPLDWSNRYNSSPVQEATKRSQGVANSSSVDALINSLVPEGLSPNKRAIAEHLITVWLQNAEA